MNSLSGIGCEILQSTCDDASWEKKYGIFYIQRKEIAVFKISWYMDITSIVSMSYSGKNVRKKKLYAYSMQNL